MRYFRLKEKADDDKKIIISGLSNHSHYTQLLMGNISTLTFTTLYPIKPTPMPFPDVLTSQIFMVKRELFKLLLLFCGDLDYRCMYLVDDKYKKDEFYYIPQIPLFNTLSPQCDSNLDKSIIKRVVIKNLTYPDVFRISNIKDCVIVISLPVAESILRRNFSGIQLEQVWLE